MKKSFLQQSMVAVLTFGGGTALLFVLAFININQGNVNIPVSTVIDAILHPSDTLAHYTILLMRLPRAAMGVIAGGALAVSGVVLQTVTKNPLASASTLGIHSGTYFIVVLSTVFFPFLLFGNGFVIAFIGGIGTFFMVYVMSGGSHASPVRMVLAGMIVTFLFSSLTSVLQIFYERETAGLFLWGSGTLVQNDWSGVVFSLPVVCAAMFVVLIMGKHLDILRLGDDMAHSLGQNVNVIKFISVVAAVVLTSVTVSVVGPIGFVGLIAPHIIKLIGYRKHVPLIIASFIWGGNVLLFADVLGRILDPSFTELPVGAITALIGAPWLIWLVLRMRKKNYGDDQESLMAGRRSAGLSVTTTVSVLLVCLVVAMFVNLASGNYGFEPVNFFQAFFGESDSFMKGLILDLRLPRAMVALLTGMMLGVSGLVFQGVLRNPLADPSIIGITSGGSVGALSMIFVFGASAIWTPIGALLGAFLFFGIVMLFAVWTKFQPTMLALLGIGMSAFGTAIVEILVVRANLNVASALTWLSGTTYGKGWPEVLHFLIGPIVIIFPLLLIRMVSMDTLALGDHTAKGLGMKVMATRFQLALLATILASFSVAAVGAIGFIGLIAPHASRLLVGPANLRLLPVSMLMGGLFLLVADVLSRTLLAPNEIPAGIIVAIIGAPYFLWLMKRSA